MKEKIREILKPSKSKILLTIFLSLLLVVALIRTVVSIETKPNSVIALISPLLFIILYFPISLVSQFFIMLLDFFVIILPTLDNYSNTEGGAIIFGAYFYIFGVAMPYYLLISVLSYFYKTYQNNSRLKPATPNTNS
jgi:hypothetical protein